MKPTRLLLIFFFLLIACQNESFEILSRYQNGQIKEQLISGIDSIPKEYVLKQIFHANGDLKCQGLKLNELREGKWNCYYKNGDLEWSATYKKGKENGTTECYYPNGTWKITNNSNGILEGLTIEFNYDSLTKQYYYVQGEYKNGLEHGKWISKYSDETTMAITNYILGSKEGEFKQYHKNGSLSVKGQFRNNKLHDSIFVYNDDSELVRIELYNKGKILKEIKMR